ncbi:N2,N2-dimethylguanosine tRNA methyltransferase [Kwoniella shandongensis]|uniref:tRNA (guanine(26)-N(2))-dimethyltransferase n=1 Tax=Kwoniella shandongensis TaxID=1734106 RepID=A0A5M6BSE3_9TREE|nr:N2,N2-dimethylguanosine tRNA methyltransferase [Kwoniella shandongensis]KAA5524900.1 N2,N2-dimethylguanosine tRNA methyltransferase [Kwoniella shandongensis]
MSSSSTPTTTPYTVPLKEGIPPNHRLHTESTTTIFLPKAGAFLNPVQHYNRDMSVAVIRAWNELRKEELEKKWRTKLEKRGGVVKPKKGKKGAAKAKTEETSEEAALNVDEPVAEATTTGEEQPVAGPSTEKKFRAPSINILEALAATGLRSIRYAKEIPNVKYVLANDLSPSACEAMRRNVEFNGVGEDYEPPAVDGVEGAEAETAVPESEVAVKEDKVTEEKMELDGETKAVNGDKAEAAKPAQAEGEPKDHVGRRPNCRGRVKINEGDACAFMYSHRSPVGPTSRVDVVDLDPYGTAAPFIDAALGCIADGGLLAITCTDLAVLAGQQYPEKCYSNYGGTNVHAEYTHEAALRLVMHSLATCAARYGRYITPLLSFSIDFYVRLFVRIDTRPEQVKRLAAQTGVVYTCQFCQTSVTQPFGKVVEKETAKGVTLDAFKTAAGPTPSHGSSCEECGSTMHLGGPLWLGPLQDSEFAKRVIKDISSQEKEYKTYNRMLGMLTIASQELPDPWFFTANRIAKSLHSSSLPMSKILSALLNAGYKISRSHCVAGAVKTDAPRSFIYDIMREEIKTNPIRMDKITEGSPSRNIINKPMTHKIDFTPHPDASLERSGKETFYQVNPLPNWGPAPRAKSIQVGQEAKRKAGEIVDELEEEEDAETKKARLDEEAAMNA